MVGRKIASRLGVVDGVVTRSLLEARWIKFFTLLNIPVEYEPERFPDTITAIGYLPDLLIHDSIYVEIKPHYSVFVKEYKRPYGFVRANRKDLLVVIGRPPADMVIVLHRRKDNSVGKQIITDGFTWGEDRRVEARLREKYFASMANDVAKGASNMQTCLIRAIDKNFGGKIGNR